MGNSDVSLSSALQSRFMVEEGQDVSGDLEEEGVILEASVRRLHSGKHSGHGNARRALTIANSVLKILELLSFSFWQTWMSSLKVQYLEKKKKS